MSTYAIGDIQGCYTALQKLLAQINFNPGEDQLWFTGDLVNRGNHSLEVLRFVKQLGNHQKTVLGNHDLHLLACALHQHPGWDEDTFSDILNAPDRDELIDWLRHQKLFHYDQTLGFCLAHAGLAQSWTLEHAISLSKEVESVLQSDQITDFLSHMYGNQPDYWDNALQGWDRLRAITNYFTRMRFCYLDGHLELTDKGPADVPHERLLPWFKLPDRVNAELDIIFGHWAALGGITNTPHVYSLDTGCVWGFNLTAMRLEDGKRFRVSCESEDR